MELLAGVILTMRRLHQPVIAAVNGAAIGGGLCPAWAADTRGAHFRAAGINGGLTASELGLSYLPPGAIDASRAPVGWRGICRRRGSDNSMYAC